MIYVATVHYRSPRWIEIQTRHMRRHLPQELALWTSLEGIDPAYGKHFDRVLEQRGAHAGKLNHLATEICHEAAPEDVLMFFDGDAFPIGDLMALVNEGFSRAPLIAVRRAENADEPQPHPCFCATTVGLWRRICGDWTPGATWPGVHAGGRNSDVGGNLLRKLELTGTPWESILRSNGERLDPLYFGIYGGVVYHHGAGFRTGELSPAHRARAPRPLPAPRSPLLRVPLRVANRARWIRWERSTERRVVRRSEEIYALIAGGGDWVGAVS
jgi:hypothetical protein